MRSLSFFALALLAVLWSPAEASTLNVPQDFPTIQAAINAAQNGDAVLVSPGTYVENINFLGKAITVMSVQGPTQTIIDGGTQCTQPPCRRTVVTFASGEGRESVLSGFTLRNGGGDSSTFDGGGIRTVHSSPTITGNVITGNRTCDGAGISANSGSPLILGNTITGNVRAIAICSAGIGGAGIKVENPGSARIIDNVISNNVSEAAGDGVGIMLFRAGSPTIQGNIISGNTAASRTTGLPCSQNPIGGGGIAVIEVPDAEIINNVIVGNSASCGGGVFWSQPSGNQVRLVNNTIADNDSAHGSGIAAVQAPMLLVNNMIVAKTGQIAMFCVDSDLNPAMFQFNDVFAPSGIPYGGVCTDQTGVNGNISADPLFVSPIGGDYRLQTGSPAIDAGTNSAPNLPATDIDGDCRTQDGDGNGSAIVDMGADEFNTKAPTARDFNGHCKAGVLWRHTSGSVAIWFFMDGGTIASRLVPRRADTDWTIVGVGDFNGDGKADILWRRTSGAVAVWFMDGPTITSVGLPGVAGTDWTIVGVGDFNGDGKADILWRHTSGTVAVWFMNGDTITSVGLPGVAGTDWTIAGVGDFNGDGKADILWRHTSGTVVIWLMDGTTITSVGVPGAPGTDWSIQGVGDFNGDGKADILWRHTSGTVAIWFMDGTTIASVGVPGAPGIDWSIQGVGDFNGDGRADILWRPTSEFFTPVVVWFMDGPTITSVAVPGAAATDWQIQ
jgi:FG-GAP-like repeat/Right handed beta helix region/FG-GAP repeat